MCHIVHVRLITAASLAVAMALVTACGGGGTTPAPTPTPTPTTANFTVTSRSAVTLSNGTQLAAGAADSCPLETIGANVTLDCTFNVTSTTGTPAAYEWTYSFGTKTATETVTSSAPYRPTTKDCGFFGGQSTSAAGNVSFIQVTVSLRVRDAQGNFSAPQSNANVRMFPKRDCGYAF